MEIRLKNCGIFDLKMLCSLDLSQMRRAWGSIEGERMWHFLKGIDLPDRETQRRSVGHSRVLPPELKSPEKARIVGRRLTAKVASRLRRMELVASKISLSVSLEGERYVELSINCDRVDDTLTFLSLFQEMWDQMIKQAAALRIKKVSVSVSKVEPSANLQYEFFTDHSREKRKKISQALDAINLKYGKDSVSFGTLPEDSFSGTKIAFTRIPDREEFFE